MFSSQVSYFRNPDRSVPNEFSSAKSTNKSVMLLVARTAFDASL